MYMSSNLTLGEAIRLYRKRAEMTQTQLGDAVGVSKSAISSYEKDQTMPNVKVLNGISRALDVPAESLYSYIHDPQIRFNYKEQMNAVEQQKQD